LKYLHQAGKVRGMYLYVRGIVFVSFSDFCVGFQKCFDGVVVFYLHFIEEQCKSCNAIVPTNGIDLSYGKATLHQYKYMPNIG
jgi:hypothetical protein